MTDAVEYITAAFVGFFTLAVLAMIWAALYATSFTVTQVADLVTAIAVPFTVLLVFIFLVAQILNSVGG